MNAVCLLLGFINEYLETAGFVLGVKMRFGRGFYVRNRTRNSLVCCFELAGLLGPAC